MSGIRAFYPERASAPLPDRHPVRMPEQRVLLGEIERAATELMWAINKHRTAWDKMARLKAAADEQGTSYYMDNQREWKLATGDVSWWRGEVNARSNSLQAMVALAGALGWSLPDRTAGFTAGQARVY